MEMDISQETVNAMQKNAVYGMEVLDAALKLVRGESPIISPGSIPPPATATATRIVGHGASSTINAPATATSSSSLAGAVTSPQETATPARAPSVPKTSTVKANKDVGGIRVIEDGPLKKLESKEGKSGDRKRQVRQLFYVSSSEAHFNFPQKTNDDGQHDGQTCLGCGATSTPEWRRGPLGAYSFLIFVCSLLTASYRASNFMQCLWSCVRKNGSFISLLYIYS